MASIRTIAILLSLLVHGTLAYALTHQSSQVRLDALDNSTGDDFMTVEQGIAIEGFSKLGDELETVETQELQAQQATPPPVEDVKPDDLKDAITSVEGKFEDNIVKSDEPPPVTTPPPPEQVTAQDQPTQVAILTEQSSGLARTAGSSTARSEYLGQLRDVLEKSKVNPRTRIAGTVVVKFKVGTNGQLLSREVASSSGSKVLDDAAVAALDRAAPFPPMPQEAAAEPMIVSVPFKFITR